MMQVSELDILRSLCRHSFADFVKEFWSTVVADPLTWNWHMDVICEVLQETAERVFASEKKRGDVVINISPGSSKSSIASIFFPAWCWTRMPHLKYIGASYAYPLALDLSRKCRDVVKSDLYQECFPEIKLSEVQDTKGYFVNTKKGQRYAVGALGSVQGMHGHIIGIDDPLDPNRAVSDAEMYQVNNWIKETLSGRKTDRRTTPMILIMQRLHQDDPTFYFLQKKGIRHICLPAELTDKVNPAYLRKYYCDGVMDPNRLPKEILEETEREMGSYAYAGQYLQDPVPAGGGMFDTSRLKVGFPGPGDIQRVVRYWDKAGTANKTRKGRGAWTVGVKMGKTWNGRYYIMDVKRVRMGTFDRERLIATTAGNDSTIVVIWIEQEPGSGGKESAEATVRGLAGYRVRLDRPVGDKETRADPYSVQVNAGNVYMVPGDWNDEYVEELRYFPYSTFKDQVDASSGAFNALIKGGLRVGGMPFNANTTPK